MKQTVVIVITSLVLGRMACGQGTVNFKNYFGHPNTDPVVYFVDGITRVSGAQYEVGLFAGPSAGNLSLIATTTFLTQTAAAGFFVDGAVAIPGIPGGSTGFFAIAVWDSTVNGTTSGATYEQAWTYAVSHGYGNMCGHSSIFSVVTGNPAATPPGIPANLVPGLTSFALYNQPPLPSPEPSPLPLVALGAAVQLLFRRNRVKRDGL